MEMSDDLLISYLLEEVSADQARDVENWRLADPANEVRFKQFQMLWDTSAILDLKEQIDAKSSLARLKMKIPNHNRERSGVLQLRLKSNWLKAVAAVVLISGAAWLYMASRPAKNLRSTTDQLVKIDTLSDGSVITLNKNSVLEYPSKFADKQRLVTLNKGEAFFDVMPDRDKPFLIKSGNISIRVVGTSFNVKIRNRVVEVIVESGRVQVTKGDQKIFLEPREKLVVFEHTDVFHKGMTQDLLYNYYRTKLFVADDTPLWRVVEVLNEAYNSRIVIKNPNIKDLPLNTTFKNESLEDILQVISRTFKISVEKKANQIILK